MKKSISLCFALFMTLCSIMAQQYYEDDFIGKWEIDNGYFHLFESGRAKVKFDNGNIEWGTWDYWDYNYKRLDISLKYSEAKLEVISKFGTSLTVRDVDTNRRYTLKKTVEFESLSATPAPKPPTKKKSSSVSGAEAGAFILGAILLGALLDSGSSSSNYQTPSASEKDRKWLERQKMIDYEIRRAEQRNY